jgi:hypothetical protein
MVLAKKDKKALIVSLNDVMISEDDTLTVGRVHEVQSTMI